MGHTLDVCDGWSDIVNLIAALAALAAVFFAYRAARETSSIRHEDRLADVAELVREVGDRMLRVTYGAPWEQNVPVAVMSLRAAAAATGERLPKTEALADAASDRDMSQRSDDEILAQVNEAFNEILQHITEARAGR